ncbi:MAG: hypothetical protein HUJ94_07265 [Bacteroidales bacterium]|nr:hypothetical protein [Bacteroidales bacterium]
MKQISISAAFALLALIFAATGCGNDINDNYDVVVYEVDPLVSAGAYYMGGNDNSDIVDVFLATEGVDVTGGQFSGQGKGCIGLWLDLNVSLESSQFIPAGRYACRKSDESFTLYPGENGKDGVTGSCLYRADKGTPQILPIIDGFVTFKVSGNLYVVDGEVWTSDRTLWTFSYSGFIAQIQEEGSDYVDMTGQLVRGWASFYGNNIYEKQPADIYNWELYLMDAGERNGIVIEMMTNTRTSQGFPAGKYEMADINGNWFLPTITIPAYEVEEDGATNGYGTWTIENNQIVYGASFGDMTISKSGGATGTYTLDYDFYDDLSAMGMKGDYNGNISISDDSAVASYAQGVSVTKASMNERPVISRTLALMGKDLARISARACKAARSQRGEAVRNLGRTSTNRRSK